MLRICNRKINIISEASSNNVKVNTAFLNTDSIFIVSVSHISNNEMNHQGNNFFLERVGMVNYTTKYIKFVTCIRRKYQSGVRQCSFIYSVFVYNAKCSISLLRKI